MPRRKAMPSDVASKKKLRGHKLERAFADMIGGKVNQGSPQAKRDVTDKQSKGHSLKSGKFWQIFLYRRQRLESNSVFQELKLSDLMIECLDAFPENRANYLKDKHTHKIALQEPMRKFANALQDNSIRKEFFERALFNTEEVDYLSIYRDDGTWHIFLKETILDFLMSCSIENSKARNNKEYSDQKVLIKCRGINLGEVELRNDSDVHYRELKFRINGGGLLLPKLIQLHNNDKKVEQIKSVSIYLYSTAQHTFNV